MTSKQTLLGHSFSRFIMTEPITMQNLSAVNSLGSLSSEIAEAQKLTEQLFKDAGVTDLMSNSALADSLQFPEVADRKEKHGRRTPPPIPARPVTLDALSSTPAPTTKQDSSSTVVEGSDGKVAQEEALTESPAPVSHRRRMIGRYELGETIGEGSSGKVKLAIHADTKERVIWVDSVCCKGHSTSENS
jgi:hypothetical protein